MSDTAGSQLGLMTLMPMAGILCIHTHTRLSVSLWYPGESQVLIFHSWVLSALSAYPSGLNPTHTHTHTHTHTELGGSEQSTDLH